VAALLATAAALSLYAIFLLHAGALWRDEAQPVVLATMDSLGEIWATLAYDTVPLASTLVLRLWTTIFSATDLGVRIFGAFVGAAFLGAVWTSSRLQGSSAPLIALALLGFNPVVVRTVGAVRPYGLAAVFIVLTLGLVWRASRDPSPAKLGLACLLAVLSVQTLYTNALLVAAICLGGAVVAVRRSGWSAAIPPLAIGAVAALSLLPYAGSLLRGWEDLVTIPLQGSWPRMWLLLKRVLGADIDWIVWLWLVVIGVGFLAAGWTQLSRSLTRSEHRDLALYGGTIMGIATPVFLLFMRNSNLPTQDWYYVSLLATVAICLEGAGAALLRGWRASLGKMILLAIVATGMTSAISSDLRIRQSNVDQIAAHLEENARGDDLIVVSPWFLGVSFRRYYEGNTPWETVPPLEDHSIHRYDLLHQRMADPRALDPLLGAIAQTLRSGGRVWIAGEMRPRRPGDRRRELPPAPHPAYVIRWIAEIEDYLATHATATEVVPVAADRRMRSRENFRLRVVTGWRSG